MSPAIERRFAQVDVFSTASFRGNPVAVVIDADGLTSEEMSQFAAWTNLSETTFLLRPTHPDADYRLRIFTPAAEIPFGGHPTLGSAHAWIEAGGIARHDGRIVQECAVGLVTLREHDDILSFAAPETVRSGPLEPAYLEKAVHALGITRSDVVSHQWVDNGSGWAAIELTDADAVLALEPDFSDFPSAMIGVVGRQSGDATSDFEVRAFPIAIGISEDPVTGSLNAGLAQWLVRSDKAPQSYIASQGARLGRSGRITVRSDSEEVLWIGGETHTLISGSVTM